MEENPVHTQIRLFALIAGLSALLALYAGASGERLLLTASLVVLLASPYIAYILVYARIRRRRRGLHV